MAAKELDSDLGTLLLAMAEQMISECPGASMMLRALEARYCDLYGRLESAEGGDLMTHTRGVSQLEALHRSIRLAATRDHAGRRRAGIFGGGLPSAPPRKLGIPTSVTPEDGAGSTTGEQVEDEMNDAAQEADGGAGD